MSLLILHIHIFVFSGVLAAVESGLVMSASSPDEIQVWYFKYVKHVKVISKIIQCFIMFITVN